MCVCFVQNFGTKIPQFGYQIQSKFMDEFTVESEQNTTSKYDDIQQKNMKKKNVIYLDSDFGQIHFHRKLFAWIDIGVMGFFES